MAQLSSCLSFSSPRPRPLLLFGDDGVLALGQVHSLPSHTNDDGVLALGLAGGGAAQGGRGGRGGQPWGGGGRAGLLGLQVRTLSPSGISALQH
jgi:hypothetical protein